jgi:hypothetical protein
VAPHLRPYNTYNYIAHGSRLATIRIRSQPREIEIIIAYAPSQREQPEEDNAELQAAIELLDYLLMHSPTIPIRINLDSRVGTLDLPPFLAVVFLICCCL